MLMEFFRKINQVGLPSHRWSGTLLCVPREWENNKFECDLLIQRSALINQENVIK